MTDIEQKALELVNAALAEAGMHAVRSYCGPCFKALCRALEAHEADKSRHAAEMREQAERFSEAAKEAIRRFREGSEQVPGVLSPFILAPVDPLAEELTHILEYAGLLSGTEANRKLAAKVLKAADALDRSLAIVKKEAVNG